MNNTNKPISINYISERDIDLLILEEFFVNKDFAKLFMKKINVVDFEITKISHSVVDINFGESDLMILFESNNEISCILIENKIDSIAMPNQCNRYIQRALKYKSEGLFDNYYIFIIAPKLYLEFNEEAKKYPNTITYEEVIDFFDEEGGFRNYYKANLLKSAVSKHQSGYQPIEDKSVTFFWSLYYQYKRSYYPHLKLNEIGGPRGSSAVWPWFDTEYPQIKIAHKSDRGYVDLTFFGINKNYTVFKNYIESFTDKDMKIRITGKSYAVRILVPIVDFKENFNLYTSQMKLIFDTIDRFNRIVEEIDVYHLYSLINNT